MRYDRLFSVCRGECCLAGLNIASAFVVACLSATLGCDRGFELEDAGSHETQPSTPADGVQGAGLDPKKDELPALPEVPKRTAAEIIAGFKALPPHEITDSALAELAALDEAVAEFATLDCSKSRITSAGLTHIGKLKNLVELKIDTTAITPAGVQEVASLPKLESLSMRGVPLISTQLPNFDAGVEVLVEMEHLTDLDLSGTRLSADGYTAIGKMVSLRRLALNDTGLNNAALSQLSGLTELETLEMSRTLITDDGFSSLKPMTKLQTLLMAETQITGAGFAELSKGRKKEGFRVVDASLTSFGQFGFVGLVGSKSLEVLLADGAGVTDSSLVGLKGCTNLRVLQLSKNEGITSLGVRNLGGLKNLEELSLNGVPRVVDNALGFLKSHKKLKRLGLNGSSCTLAGIQRLKQLLPELKVVYMGQEL